MVSFDEQAILDKGAYIYNQRAEIERIADEICEKGFDSIFFTSSGGSLAMMQPFDYMVSVMSDIPVQSQISADFLTAGNRRIGKGTLAFMASLRLAWTVHRLVNFPIMEWSISRAVLWSSCCTF